MPIRMASSCGQCTSFTATNFCNTHTVEVTEQYTCDQFSSEGDLNKSIDCGSCARFKRDDYEHPDIATKGMLCTSWAPKV